MHYDCSDCSKTNKNKNGKKTLSKSCDVTPLNTYIISFHPRQNSVVYVSLIFQRQTLRLGEVLNVSRKQERKRKMLRDHGIIDCVRISLYLNKQNST